MSANDLRRTDRKSACDSCPTTKGRGGPKALSQVLVRHGLASNGESRFSARGRCHTIPRCGAKNVVATACVPKTCVRRSSESQRLRLARRIYTSLGSNGRFSSPSPSSFILHPSIHPSTFILSPRGGLRAMRPRRAGPRALIEIRIVKEQCRLSLRERCGFRGAKGKASTVIYVWPRLIFKSDLVSPCHEPRCRPRMVCLAPINGRCDPTGKAAAKTCSRAVPFQSASRRRAENGGPFSPAACPATQWDKISVRLPGSVDASCVFICVCCGHGFFACPTGVISPWQAIDPTSGFGRQ